MVPLDQSPYPWNGCPRFVYNAEGRVASLSLVPCTTPVMSPPYRRVLFHPCMCDRSCFASHMSVAEEWQSRGEVTPFPENFRFWIINHVFLCVQDWVKLISCPSPFSPLSHNSSRQHAPSPMLNLRSVLKPAGRTDATFPVVKSVAWPPVLAPNS